jgi:hypothetical protein
MPDLQTEMQKILQSWDQPETTETTETTQQLETTENTMFKPTTNTTRATFEIVRDQPGLTKNDYVRLLEGKGFKKASTSSLLSQMLRQGHIWLDSSGCLRPNQKEYSPLKAVKVFKAKKVKTSKLRTSEEVEAPKPKLIEVPVRTNIEVILDTITLSEAHELYSKLHRYFGGLPK